MKEMSSLTFPDGSSYEIVDETARKELSNTKTMITDAFDITKNYVAGDYCIYKDVLYVFTADKSAGEWDNSSVEATNISNIIHKLNKKMFTESTQVTASVPVGYSTINLEPPTYNGCDIQPIFISTSTTQNIIIMSHGTTAARVYSEATNEISVIFTIKWLIIRD